MNLVIDTSALIAVIANEPSRSTLVGRTAGAVLLAPASVHSEVGNAFSAMLKRKRVTPEQVQRALAVYRAIPLRFVEVELDVALALAADLDVYAYDAYLIAAAQRQRCPLLTLDAGLVHAARSAGVSILEVEA